MATATPDDNNFSINNEVDARFLTDDGHDMRTAGVVRYLLLGNPNLEYVAEDRETVPEIHRGYLCQMVDGWEPSFDELFGARELAKFKEQKTTRALAFDYSVKLLRERYRSLNELPSKYAVAYGAAIFLRRCDLPSRHPLCLEHYFYTFDDRFQFLETYRGQQSDREITGEKRKYGCGSVKNVCRQFYDGLAPHNFYGPHGNRPYESEWNEMFEKRNLSQVLIDICANPSGRNWTHREVIRYAHFSSMKPWRTEEEGHQFRLMTLVADKGAREALDEIEQSEEASVASDGGSVAFKESGIIVEWLEPIAKIKESYDSEFVAAELQKRPRLCGKIFPGGIVPTRHYKNEKVCAVFAESSALRDVLHYLPSWVARGIVEDKKPQTDVIAGRLMDREEIKKERFSPAELLMAGKRFERYGQQQQRQSQILLNSGVGGMKLGADDGRGKPSRKRKQPGSTPYNPPSKIRAAFADAFETSFENFRSADRGVSRISPPFFIAVDAKKSILEHRIYGATYLDGIDVISCLLTIAARNISDVHLGHLQSNGMSTPILVPRNIRIDKAAQRLQDYAEQSDVSVDLTAPFAKSDRTASSFFILITDRPPKNNKNWFADIRRAMKEYGKEKMVRGGIKTVVWFLERRRAPNADPLPISDDPLPISDDPLPICDDLLVIHGWNHCVPEVIWSFARGELDDDMIAPPISRG